MRIFSRTTHQYLQARVYNAVAFRGHDSAVKFNFSICGRYRYSSGGRDLTSAYLSVDFDTSNSHPPGTSTHRRA